MFNNDFESRSKSGNMALFGIICITVLFFILTSPSKSPITNHIILTADTVKDFQLWRLVTSMLYNYSPWNLFFNLFALYIFGSLSTPILGPSKAVGLYLFSGLVGNLLWFAFSWNVPNAMIFGCDGGVMGVIMATAILMPNMQMYLLFVPFPIKIKTMAIVFLILELFFSRFSPFALLCVGGFLGGYLFMQIFARKYIQWRIFDFLRPKNGSSPHPTYTFQTNPRPKTDQPANRNEIDRILEKLSRTGINSLTPEEVKVLEDLREQMRKK